MHLSTRSIARRMHGNNVQAWRRLVLLHTQQNRGYGERETFMLQLAQCQMSHKEFGIKRRRYAAEE